MVGAGTKRRRRDRANLVAAAVEEGRRQAEAEKKALGTTVSPDVPDSALFVVDRKGETTESITKYIQDQAVEQRRAAKRARRTAPKVRKSEAAAIAIADATAKLGYFPGKKKRRSVATVEKQILSKRKFDKPEGHAGNIRSAIREARQHSDGKEDLWSSETSKIVSEEIGLNRKRLTKKMNAVQRTATSIIHPSSGMSVNPTHEDHQDKLGEALARIVQKDDLHKWDAQKMSFDPALLDESREGEVADTGMKCDENDTSDEDSEEEEESCYRGVPERKTRTQRHKETRKRIMAANIARKQAETRRAYDLEHLHNLTKEAEKEADKLNGTAKERRLKEAPPSTPCSEKPVLKKIGGQKVRNELASDPVPLSEELAETMRGIKMPVANPVLRDRFLSFERRGLVEPPKVLPKELWRMEHARRQEELRDKRKRKGRGSRSNLTFWRSGKRIIQ